MVEEKTTYDGQGLKGALWTIAGTSIASVAQKLVSGVMNGGMGCGGRGGNAVVVEGMNAVGNGVIAELMAKNAKLEAEKYSDNAAKEQAERLLVNYLKPYGDAIAANQVVVARQQAEIDCLKKTQELEKQILYKDIELAKQEAKCCCEKNGIAIAALTRTVEGITKVVVPNSAVCPGWGEVDVTPATAAA